MQKKRYGRDTSCQDCIVLQEVDIRYNKKIKNYPPETNSD